MNSGCAGEGLSVGSSMNPEDPAQSRPEPKVIARMHGSRDVIVSKASRDGLFYIILRECRRAMSGAQGPSAQVPIKRQVLAALPIPPGESEAARRHSRKARSHWRSA